MATSTLLVALGLAVLAAGMAAVTAAAVRHMGGAPPADCLATGGHTFAVALTLMMTVAAVMLAALRG